MTQTESILRHLKTHGSITPLDALNKYGCMRLGARIYDLRKTGVQIVRMIETRKNKVGENKRYARYYLKEEAK